MNRDVGLLLLAVGGGIALVGLLAMTGALGWCGNLPGDIRIERPGTRVYVPITSMILASVGVSLVLWLLRR